ncbi:MAG TPA: hypothetical protein VIV12_06785 [Streptosporangiaceae bacterium]
MAVLDRQGDAPAMKAGDVPGGCATQPADGDRVIRVSADRLASQAAIAGVVVDPADELGDPVVRRLGGDHLAGEPALRRGNCRHAGERDQDAASWCAAGPFPGDTSDQKIIRIKDDLDGWNLRRLVWVADRGFASAANRAYLTRGGGHYVHAEKLRRANTEAAAALSRQSRYHTGAGNLQVKEVSVLPRPEGMRAERFVSASTSRPPSVTRPSTSGWSRT